MLLNYRLLNVTCSFQYAVKKDILIIADIPTFDMYIDKSEIETP